MAKPRERLKGPEPRPALVCWCGNNAFIVYKAPYGYLLKCTVCQRAEIIIAK